MAEIATAGAAVVDSLACHGVDQIFGIPGTHNLEVYRYLPASGIRHVVTRHEQAAGYAADGYARVTGQPGVLLTTSGPGITNAITALATAYADSVPVLALSPGPPRGYERADRGWLHEVKDQQAALEAVCRTSIRVDSADAIPEAIATAFELFHTRRPRPVHVEVPTDVLEGTWQRRPLLRRAGQFPPRPEVDDVRRIASTLAAARRPLIIAGGGARAGAEQIRALAELGVPVLTTVNGKGILDERHASSLGAAVRLPSAHRVVNRADVLLIVGSEVGDADLWGGAITAGGDERTVVRVDIDAEQQNKNVPADLSAIADSGATLRELLALLGGRHFAPWPDGELEASRAAILADAERDAGPWAAIQGSLRTALPDDVVVAGDSSQVSYYGTVHHWPFGPANRLLYPTGYATLGYGLPAAIGAKLAHPSRPVICLIGDGAAMFSIQELVTATEQRLPLPVVVVDNGGYAEIREQMQERGIPTQGVDLLVPDLPALARAMGAHGVVAHTVDELGPAAASALHEDRPTLIYYRTC